MAFNQKKNPNNFTSFHCIPICFISIENISILYILLDLESYFVLTGKFDGNIFYVTVSKTPNLNNIVKTLFEHCGSQVPEFQSDEDAIKQLRHLLRKVGRNPILLVLDDVWPRSEGLVKKFKFQMSEEDLKGKKFVGKIYAFAPL